MLFVFIDCPVCGHPNAMANADPGLIAFMYKDSALFEKCKACSAQMPRVAAYCAEN